MVDSLIRTGYGYFTHDINSNIDGDNNMNKADMNITKNNIIKRYLGPQKFTDFSAC